MQNFSRRTVFFVLLLGILFIGYVYMIKPANAHLAEKRIQVQEKQKRLSEFEQATSMTESLTKQLDQLKEAVEFFESQLPPKSEIYKVLEQVTMIAQKQGLKPKSIKTLEKKDNNGYIEQPLRMSLEGGFNSFYSFLLELEKLPRIMKIRELEVKKEKDGAGQVTINFVVSIFFQNRVS